MGGGSVRVQLCPPLQGLCAQQRGDLSSRPRLPERLPFSLEAGIFQMSVDRSEGWKHYVRRALKPSGTRGEKWGILRRPVKEKGEGCVGVYWRVLPTFVHIRAFLL